MCLRKLSVVPNYALFKWYKHIITNCYKYPFQKIKKVFGRKNRVRIFNWIFRIFFLFRFYLKSHLNSLEQLLFSSFIIFNVSTRLRQWKQQQILCKRMRKKAEMFQMLKIKKKLQCINAGRKKKFLNQRDSSIILKSFWLNRKLEKAKKSIDARFVCSIRLLDTWHWLNRIAIKNWLAREGKFAASSAHHFVSRKRSKVRLVRM